MSKIVTMFPYQEKEILSEITTLQKSLHCQIMSDLLFRNHIITSFRGNYSTKKATRK